MKNLESLEIGNNKFKIQQILYAVRLGISQKRVIAHHAGMSVQTLNRWLQLGEQGKPGYHEFLISWKKAEAESKIEALAAIRAAFTKDWKAAAWYLEKTDPVNFGVQQYDSRDISLLLFELAMLYISGRTNKDELYEQFPAIADKVINMVDHYKEENMLEANYFDGDKEPIVIENEIPPLVVEEVNSNKIKKEINPNVVENPEVLSDDTKYILSAFYDTTE